MKEENIVLKKGDKVYYTKLSLIFIEKHSIVVDYYDGYTIKKFEREVGGKITKIERPINYETIYEAPKEILDKEEKEYLEAVLKPFRNKIEHIRKATLGFTKEFLYIALIDESFGLPNFDRNTMYKGMEAGKRYTLAELGLFEGE